MRFEKLCDRASHTLVQVTRRLGILDREYGFIRTNIFWVRDQEPIGLITLTQGAREFNVLVKGLLRLVKETVKPNLWGHPSVEFLVTALAVLVFPIVLVRLRRMLGELIKRDLAAPAHVDARLAILGTGVGQGGDLAALSGSPCLRGPGRSLAAQPGHTGLGRDNRRGDCDPCPRPAALADFAIRVAGALPGRAARGGSAAQHWRPFRGRGGCGLFVAGLPFRPRADRARGQTDHGPGTRPAAGSGLRAGRLGNVCPTAARLFAAFGVGWRSRSPPRLVPSRRC